MTNNQTAEYRSLNLYPLDEKGQFPIKIKIVNPNNCTESNWLNITFEEFEAIKALLTNEED